MGTTTTTKGLAMTDETTSTSDDEYADAGIASDGDDRISAFWQAARGHVGFGKMESIVGGSPLDVVPPPSFALGGDDGEQLAEILATGVGETSAPREQFEELPRVGDLAIVLDASNEPTALIRTTEVIVGDEVVERFELVYPTTGPAPAVDYPPAAASLKNPRSFRADSSVSGGSAAVGGCGWARLAAVGSVGEMGVPRGGTRARVASMSSHADARTINLAVVAGDGIGTEVVEQGLLVLDAVLAGSGVGVQTTSFDLGARRWHATGETLTDTDLDAIRDPRRDPARRHRRPDRPVGRPRARAAAQAALRARPLRQPAPVASCSPASRRRWRSPGEIDFVVVREGTEGPYVGNGGAIRVGTPHEVANEVSLNTAFGVERVVRDAFARAQARPRKKLTLVHKHNVLVHAGHLWRRTVEAVDAEFPDVTVDYLHVDAATIFLVTEPGAVRRHRDRQPVRRHPHRPRRGDHAAASAWPPRRNINPDRTTPQHVRARARLRPRHRRARARPTRRPPCSRSPCCWTTSGLADEARAVEAAVAADIAERGRPSTVDGRGGQGPRRARRRLTRSRVRPRASPACVACPPGRRHRYRQTRPW